MNSFELDPLKADFGLIDREKEAEELLYRVTSGDMVLLEGKRGLGKTQLLKYVIDNFRGKGKVIYVDGKKVSKHLDINELIYEKPKGMILLLDNVKHITKRNNEKIKYAYDEEHIRSVVFTTDDRTELTLTDSILERIDHNIITLEKYPFKTIQSIIESRSIDLVDEKLLKRIYNLTGNVKDLLLTIRASAERCLENGNEEITSNDIVVKKEEDTGVSNYCDTCEGKLEHVNGVWRCPYCDNYCSKCGTYIIGSETHCPECGKEVTENENVVS